MDMDHAYVGYGCITLARPSLVKGRPWGVGVERSVNKLQCVWSINRMWTDCEMKGCT